MVCRVYEWRSVRKGARLSGAAERCGMVLVCNRSTRERRSRSAGSGGAPGAWGRLGEWVAVRRRLVLITTVLVTLLAGVFGAGAKIGRAAGRGGVAIAGG